MKPCSTISFILDNEVRTIDFRNKRGIRPTTTVLNYLRSLPDHKGVKEGCGEGDCGACTVVVAEPSGEGKLKYQALDSCILFLPMIHGKQLITVENLAERRNGTTKLHPVQQAIVGLNGSQCGYCTPGIVMSLFALYKNCDSPSREIAEDALAGNLCRCTGYQPILDAALQACSNRAGDHFTTYETEVLAKLMEINAQASSLQCFTDDQNYFRPATLREALKIRNNHPDAIVTNGSTDMALRQTKKHEHLAKILDLSAVKDIKFFRNKKDAYHFGAGLTIEKLKKDCEKKLPALYDMLAVFASLQIRNVATLGGNVGSSSPIGDIIPLLFAYGAKIVIAGAKNKREVHIEDFIKGYRTNDLQAGELIHSIIIPKPEKNIYFKSYKVSKRKDLDISTVSGAFRLKLNKERIIEQIVLAFGGMAEQIRRSVKTEDFLLGKIWGRETVETAMKIIQEDFSPISDARSGKEFRSIAAGNLLLKFFVETSMVRAG